MTGNDSRQVETQSVIATEGYYEYRYGTRRNASGSHATFCPHGEQGGTYSVAYTSWSKTRYYDYDDGETDWRCQYCGTFYTYNIGGRKYYWEEKRYVEPVYKTQYRYRDRTLIYTYYFKRTENLELGTYPTGNDISNIQEWVQYRPK